MYTPIWIVIPAGEFRMGSDPAGDAVPYGNESPRHRVAVEAFQLSRTHITNAQYAKALFETWNVDATTVHAYIGGGDLEPFFFFPR